MALFMGVQAKKERNGDYYYVRITEFDGLLFCSVVTSVCVCVGIHHCMNARWIMIYEIWKREGFCEKYALQVTIRRR